MPQSYCQPLRENSLHKVSLLFKIFSSWAGGGKLAGTRTRTGNSGETPEMTQTNKCHHLRFRFWFESFEAIFLGGEGVAGGLGVMNQWSSSGSGRGGSRRQGRAVSSPQ